ncbi:MAG: hypothetical protein HRU43_03880 [Simkaniaceae bacterium]|nr:hypothetical protein [Simkaniaceae bacterium]
MGISGVYNSVSNLCASCCKSVVSTSSGKAAVAVGMVATAVVLGKCAYNYFSKPINQEPRIDARRVALANLPSPEEYTESTKETIRISRDVIGFEDTDKNELYDPSINSIPGTCFEIGSALSILESPGKAGLKMDSFAGDLSKALDRIYQTSLGSSEVIVGKDPESGKDIKKTLRDVFNNKLLKEIRPSSDQIGRCTNPDLEKDWFDSKESTGLEWLQDQLKMSSTDPKYTHENMLTKIRMISAFGTVLRELTPVDENHKALADILGKDSLTTVPERYGNVVSLLRHEQFDNPITRARSERPPIIDGESVKISKTTLGNRQLQSAGSLKLGFGQVYGPESFDGEPELYQRYLQVEKESGGRQGIEREGQPIYDSSRPGVISEYGMKKMPKSFEKAGLPQLLKSKAFAHGTGVNRWSLTGTYSKQSWLKGLPSAGAHSGGTVDILLALDCLSNKTICGDKETVLQSGLLISSFMNFGGYHSFNETFPIAQAYANSETFNVNGSREARQLYGDFADTAQQYANQAHEKIGAFQNAYRSSFDKRIISLTKDFAKLQIGKTPNGNWEAF